MKKIGKTSVLVAAVTAAMIVGLYGPAAQTAAAQTPAASGAANFSELADRARPGVVNIRTERTVKGGGRVFRHFFGGPFGNRSPFDEFFDRGPSRDFKQRSLGSGFVFDHKGHIVTNNHVIEGADQIKVKLADGQELDAALVGRDPKTDVAIIKVSGAEGLTPLSIGDSDRLKVGTWVVAIGSPFGLEQTVTAGIVSAKGRIIGSGPYDDFIQTDASINPGNSGGPLLDLNGQVVGINTAIVAQGQGIGFAIPINLARGIIDQLIQTGRVTRGWLGVAIQDLTPDLARYYGVDEETGGVLVSEVFEGDPAARAGIRPNDIILAVDGKAVRSSRELSGLIAGLTVGQQTRVALLRNGQSETVTVTMAKQRDGGAAENGSTEQVEPLGLGLADLTAELAPKFGLETEDKGVVVTRVDEGSRAAEAGIRVGDVIKELDRRGIDTLQDWQRQVERIPSGQVMHLLVKRPRSGFLVFKMLK